MTTKNNGNGGSAREHFMRWVKDLNLIVALVASVFGAGMASAIWRYVAPAVILPSRVSSNIEAIRILAKADTMLVFRMDTLHWGLRWLICRHEIEDSLIIRGISSSTNPTGCEWMTRQAPTLFIR